MVEYLDPEIANEGQSVNNWVPGDWTHSPATEGEEYQPEMEPPHINDYAMLKKSKQFAKYFKPYRYVPFPAVLYHATKGEKIVNSEAEVIALGAEWRREPFVHKIDMTGKSHPAKSDTQRLAEVIAEKTGHAAIDPNLIAAIVASAVAAVQKANPPTAMVHEVQHDPRPDVTPSEGLRSFLNNPVPEENRFPADDMIERNAAIELAEREGVKIDKRWSTDRIKEALGLK